MTVVLARKYSRILGSHLAGQGERNPRQGLPQHPPYPLLVLRVGVGVKQADGNRFHPLLCQAASHPRHGRFIQGSDHPPPGIQALGDPETEVTGHQRPGFLELEVVETGPNLAGDLQQVSKPLGGDEAGAGNGALDDGVGGHGGPVHQVGHLGGVDAVFRSESAERLPAGPANGPLAVEGTLPIRISPVASLIRVASVKVPPMSIPSR